MVNLAKVADALSANPVLVTDVVKYAVTALVLLGLPLPPGVDVAIIAVVHFALAFYTRSKVTPLSKIVAQQAAAMEGVPVTDVA